jgi:dienelactone hydrolase
MTARVRIRRKRLIPQQQILDIRNALYYLQGEPGVDRSRVGVWGAGMAGGHVLVIAATDARVRAAVAHVPVIEGKDAPKKASAPAGELLQAELKRARLGEQASNASAGALAALETRVALAEYHPFWYVEQIPQTTAVLFVITDRGTVSNESNATNARSC